MLAIAYERADESIDERPVPSEFGTYIFDVREKFTTVVAASGGYYVEVTTNADNHYNATGLQRVHRAGVELSPLTDSACDHRAYIGGKDDPKIALAPGLQWKDGSDWVGLADFHRFEPPPKPKEGEKPASPQRVVHLAELAIDSSTDRASFTLTYHLEGPGAREVREHYVVSSDGVTVEQSAEGSERFVLPVLVNDGARDTKLDMGLGTLAVTRAGGSLKFTSIEPKLRLSLGDPKVPTHNGYVQPVVGDNVKSKVTWKLTLEPYPLHMR